MKRTTGTGIDSRPEFPHPSKRFGQHFLTDKRIIDRIIKSVAPHSQETIIEIGPGRGALTAPLLEKAGMLVAVEFDRELVPLLKENFSTRENLRLLQQDVLNTDFCKEILPASSARIVANLPYNIATAILQRMIEQRRCLTEAVVMLQREVADRITAQPGSTERGYLSVLIEAYCGVEHLFDVAPGAFRPPPKVWSSVIRLKFHPAFSVPVANEVLLWEIVSAGFRQRRKTILNNLRHAPGELQELVKRHGGASIVLCKAQVELNRRAETLTLDEWATLSMILD